VFSGTRPTVIFPSPDSTQSAMAHRVRWPAGQMRRGGGDLHHRVPEDTDSPAGRARHHGGTGRAADTVHTHSTALNRGHLRLPFARPYGTSAFGLPM
jgi:hypothetical protein